MPTARTPQELVAVWRSLAQHWQAARSESRAERGRFRVLSEMYADRARELEQVLAAGAQAQAAHEADIAAEMATGYDPAAEGCAPELSQDEWDAILPEEE